MICEELLAIHTFSSNKIIEDVLILGRDYLQ